MPGQSDWDPGHRGQHQGYMELATGTDQRLSDMMPDIAMAGQYPVSEISEISSRAKLKQMLEM